MTFYEEASNIWLGPTATAAAVGADDGRCRPPLLDVSGAALPVSLFKQGRTSVVTEQSGAARFGPGRRQHSRRRRRRRRRCVGALELWTNSEYGRRARACLRGVAEIHVQFDVQVDADGAHPHPGPGTTSQGTSEPGTSSQGCSEPYTSSQGCSEPYSSSASCLRQRRQRKRRVCAGVL